MFHSGDFTGSEGRKRILQEVVEGRTYILRYQTYNLLVTSYTSNVNIEASTTSYLGALIFFTDL